MYLVFIFKHMQIVADMNMHTSLCVSEQTLLFFISNVAPRCKRYCKWQCGAAFLWFLNFWSIGHKSIHISKCTNDLYVMSFIHEFLTSLIDSTLIGAFVSNKIYLWTTGTKKSVYLREFMVINVFWISILQPWRNSNFDKWM